MKHGSGNKTLLVGRPDTKQNRRVHMMITYYDYQKYDHVRFMLRPCWVSLRSFGVIWGHVRITLGYFGIT